jgi:hypothetical protein
MADPFFSLLTIRFHFQYLYGELIEARAEFRKKRKQVRLQ